MFEKLDPVNVAVALNDLGVRFSQCHDPFSAQMLLMQAFLIQKESLGLNHPDVVTSLIRLAAVYRMQGREKEANLFYDFSKEVSANIFSPFDALNIEAAERVIIEDPEIGKSPASPPIC